MRNISASKIIRTSSALSFCGSASCPKRKIPRARGAFKPRQFFAAAIHLALTTSTPHASSCKMKTATIASLFSELRVQRDRQQQLRFRSRSIPMSNDELEETQIQMYESSNCIRKLKILMMRRLLADGTSSSTAPFFCINLVSFRCAQVH